MFGKTRDPIDSSGEITVDDFFGDEAAAAEASAMDDVRRRLQHVESQINSQFTSMAAYAQIAQEQVELARSEAKVATERSERRVVELIERERADRVEAVSGRPVAGGDATSDVEARLDTLERSVMQIRAGLDECLERQKALADAITALFEPQISQTLPPPNVNGTIDDLSLA